MDLREINKNQKEEYNKLVTHLIQSWEWGQFRQSLGSKLKRFGLYQKGKLKKAFQITFHQIPFTNYFVGYFAKGPLPNKELVEALQKIGRDNRCAFIKLEPDVRQNSKNHLIDSRLKVSPKPLFTKFNYLIDLSQSEEELLTKMHPKTRYNIKVAQKHGVTIEERTDEEALEIYLRLYFATTKRQGFLGHNESYHRKVWQILHDQDMARLLIAFYTPPGTKTRISLNAWMLMNFKETLYYPYGGSSTEYKNVMAPVLTSWEAVKLGKKLDCKTFDLWGAGDPGGNQSDPYAGFTRFKANLGAELVEYTGTFDLVLIPLLYYPFTFIDKLMPLKILLLKLIGKS